MSETVQSQGTTPSERYLARLAERSFLNLWSYPNLYRDQLSKEGAEGKELCDLLVVCGDHVIVFSDKRIAWPQHNDIGVAWSRWARRALAASAKQVRGAQRWIEEYPDRIFLDRACTQKFPLALPPLERRRIHGVVVALGAGAACRRYFDGGSGSLVISPSIIGDTHWTPGATGFSPFKVGELCPNGPFIHVFDDASLGIVMRELDTIADFTSYLQKKETLIRAGRLAEAHGEEDLLAYYSVRMNENEEHDFTRPDHKPWEPGDKMVVEGGHYTKFVQSNEYRARARANEPSYIWDRLITVFTTNMLAGTTIMPFGGSFALSEHEQAIRHMAFENRFRRRLHGDAILGALEKGKQGDRFCRAMIPDHDALDNETGFFFLTFARPDFAENYDEYRRIRILHLEAYGLGFLQRNRHLKRIVGIATEPPGKGQGSSEDLLLIEPGEWTKELDDRATELAAKLNILQARTLKPWRYKDSEFLNDPVEFVESLHETKSGKRRRRRARGRK